MIVNKEKPITQKEVIELCNTAYDRGGSEVLKLLKDTANQIAVDTPEYREMVAFSLYLIEAVRQRLSEVVTNQEHDQIPEQNIIV